MNSMLSFTEQQHAELQKSRAMAASMLRSFLNESELIVKVPGKGNCQFHAMEVAGAGMTHQETC